eukprot:TRINITY_DN10564_c0_g1_i4.p1 TRINITY_DN10564_c0_g1~~TRINITY_DN10564_c0_g1_i4.p1  ORF type:complete len:136 (-),score=27.71 TRINITY_DN10564_c0_g1_i4:64-471(-)
MCIRDRRRVRGLLTVRRSTRMVYICSDPKSYIGKHHGESEECVALVKHACKAPQTSKWNKGDLVKGNSPKEGTGIATFEGPGASYQGHAAIYLSQDSNRIKVIDQWKGHAASERVIRFGGTNGVSNDGNKFYVIE